MKHYTERSFVEKYPLSAKKIWKKMISTSLLWLVTSLLFLRVITGIVFAPVFQLTTVRYEYLILFGMFIILILALGINYFYQKRYIETYFYNMTDKFLVIRKGILMPQEITVPIERIQDVYVDQDVFDQLFGLYDVHISTATAASTIRAHIDGVDKKTAEELRELILSKLHK